MIIHKTPHYNGRKRKERDVLAVIIGIDGNILDVLHPGSSGHAGAVDWAAWRAESIKASIPMPRNYAFIAAMI